MISLSSIAYSVGLRVRKFGAVGEGYSRKGTNVGGSRRELCWGGEDARPCPAGLDTIVGFLWGVIVHRPEPRGTDERNLVLDDHEYSRFYEFKRTKPEERNFDFSVGEDGGVLMTGCTN
jgi:hypothetical protein